MTEHYAIEETNETLLNHAIMPAHDEIVEVTETRYNHAYSFAFEIQGSHCKDGTDVTPSMLRSALLKRFNTLTDEGFKQAVGCAWDTHAED